MMVGSQSGLRTYWACNCFPHLSRERQTGAMPMNLPDRPIRDDPFHQAALHTHDILDSSGFEIEVIPEPNRHRVRSEDFVASYVNYYVCNGAAISAQFGDRETDAIAADALARHYTEREIVTLNADALRGNRWRYSLRHPTIARGLSVCLI